MSKVAISGGATGSATYTIQAPTGSTDRVLTLPDEAGTVLTSAGAGTDYLTPTGDGSGLTGISSYANSDALTLFNATDSSAPVFAIRAWVSHDNSSYINGSGNVSSVTKHGTGDYQINFSTAFSGSSNYAVAGITDDFNNAATARIGRNQSGSPLQSGSVRMAYRDSSNTLSDPIYAHVMIVGD